MTPGELSLWPSKKTSIQQETNIEKTGTVSLFVGLIFPNAVSLYKKACSNINCLVSPPPTLCIPYKFAHPKNKLTIYLTSYVRINAVSPLF